MSDEDDTKAIESEFKEYVDGNLPDQDDPDAHWYTGLVHDSALRNVLAYMTREYEPLTNDMPAKFEDTKFARGIAKEHGSDTGTVALQTGNMGMLSYFSGLVGYKTDVSGMQTLLTLQDLIEKFPVFIAYIFAAMGFGKTDFALLLIEVFESVYGADNVETASNIESWKESDQYIDNFRDWIAWLKEGRDDDKQRILIIDEAAQALTGSGKDQKKQRVVGKMLKLARKYGGHVIFIGQDGKDVGPAIRALSSCVIEKKSQKEAVFYQDVVDRNGVGEILSMSGVPATSMNYDTEDISTWSMGDDEENDENAITQADLDELVRQHEREMMAILYATTELTNDDVADIYDVAEKTVRRARKQNRSKLVKLGLVEEDE